MTQQTTHDAVRIVEVGPRDGLQNEKAVIETADKIAMIHDLVAAGARTVEFTSYVNPKKVPQMGDAEAVAEGIARVPGVAYTVLVLNERGYDRAIAATTKPHAIGYAIGATDTFNLKNAGQTVADALEQFRTVARRARADGVAVRGYVSLAFGCPFEGRVPQQRVYNLAKAMLDIGVDELVIADTIGTGNPRQVGEILSYICELAPQSMVGTHFHDTRGMGLANAVAALQVGVRGFDASVGGLGGCPFAPGATGNIATEDLAYMLHAMGYPTGLNIAAVAQVARRFEKLIGKPLPGHVKNTDLNDPKFAE